MLWLTKVKSILTLQTGGFPLKIILFLGGSMQSVRISIKGRYWREGASWHAEIAPMQLKVSGTGPYSCLQQLRHSVTERMGAGAVACGIESDDKGIFYITGNCDGGFLRIIAEQIGSSGNYGELESWLNVHPQQSPDSES
jgi:hypothetical protein